MYDAKEKREALMFAKKCIMYYIRCHKNGLVTLDDIENKHWNCIVDMIMKAEEEAEGL